MRGVLLAVAISAGLVAFGPLPTLAADLSRQANTPAQTGARLKHPVGEQEVVSVYLPQLYVSEGCLDKGSCLPPRVVRLRHRHVIPLVKVDVLIPRPACAKCAPPAGLLLD